MLRGDKGRDVPVPRRWRGGPFRLDPPLSWRASTRGARARPRLAGRLLLPVPPVGHKGDKRMTLTSMSQ